VRFRREKGGPHPRLSELKQVRKKFLSPWGKWGEGQVGGQETLKKCAEKKLKRRFLGNSEV